MVYFSDALTLDAPKRVGGGYMAVRARAARTGVYQYAGREVDPDNAHGLRDQASVNVLRDEATVFDPAAVRSFIGKPVTDDHPKEAVTRDNWRDHSRGVIMGALRDGDHLAFDLLLMDGPTIDKVDAGKRQLSNGYSAELEFGDFKAPDGTACQARQSRISDGNHVALVDAARGGSSCRIGDAAPCSAQPQSFLDALTTQEKPVKKILLDGLTVDIADPDTAERTVNTLRDQRDAATAKVTAAETKAVTDAATIVAKDAEIAKLTADVAAAKLTPQQMRDAGKAYALVCAKAKASGVTVTDAMDEDAIMKAVVDKAMPGNTYAGDHVRIAFDTLTKDVNVEDGPKGLGGSPIALGDTGAAATESAARQRMIDRLSGKKPVEA